MFVELFDAYSGERNIMMEEEFWKFLTDAQVLEDSLLKGKCIDVLNESLSGALHSR